MLSLLHGAERGFPSSSPAPPEKGLDLTRRTLQTPTIIVAAMLLACAVAFVAAVREAEAAFPGQNGRIAFDGYRDAGGGNSATEILTVSPGGGTKQLTSASGAGDPAFAPDGARIAYSGGFTLADRDNEIFVTSNSGEGRRALTNNTVPDYEPAWSPDGDRIAFVRQDKVTVPGGGPDWQVDVWTMNADGSGQKKLTNDLSYEGAPSWSPNGSKIAFQRTGVGSDIWMMNADGTGQRRLTGTLYAENDPDFSPDGSKLAFTSDRQYNKEEVYTMNLDGTALTNVTNSRYVAEGEPAWSPDGAKVAYTKSLSGNIEIFTKNADGSGRPQNVSNDPEHNASPDWGPRPATAP